MTTAVEKHSDIPYEGVVEIRIHGVSGTPPSELLDRQVVTAVAGDQSAGFYQPAVDSQRRDRPHGSNRKRGPWLEAFSWSGLTSGSASRALWILLLPFGLINVAPYAVPGPARESLEDRWATWRERVTATSRILAGTLTAAITIGACGVGMLTIGARCATTETTRTCFGLPLWITDLLGYLSPQWRWAAGSIVPILLVVMLMLISRRSDRGEAVPEPLGSAAIDQIAAPEIALTPSQDSEFALAKHGLWTSEVWARRQRGIHGQLALVVTGLVAGWPVTAGSGLRWWLLAAAGLALVCDVRLLWWGHGAAKSAWGGRLHIVGWVAVYALGVIAIVACAAATGIAPADELMIGFDLLLRLGFIGQALIVIWLVVGVAMTRRLTDPARRRRLFLAGWSTAVFAMGAWLLGAASTTGLMIAVPSWLATPGLTMGPNSLARTMAERPTWFAPSVGSSGFAILVVVIVGLIAALCCLVWVVWSVWLPWGVGRHVDQERVDLVYQLPKANTDSSGMTPRIARLRRTFQPWSHLEPKERRRAIEVARIFWWARRTDYVPRLIGIVGGISLVLLVVVFVVDLIRTDWLRWRPEAAQALLEGETRPKGLTGAVAWGIWMAAFGLVVVVLLSLLATRDSTLRRHIGIVWDIASFWPRDTHPLAPPCYNERAIPQLVHRIRHYAGDLTDPTEHPAAGMRGEMGDRADHRPGEDDVTRPLPRRVIVAGHSQGSVIGVAAIMNLPPSIRSRVALLTYGSVLSRLYSRFFPQYFGPAELAKVADALEGPDGVVRWRNLYRYSDFLGGPIDRQSEDPEKLWDVDVRCPDPLFRSQPGDSIYPAAGRHSRFERDPSFQQEIGRLVKEFGHRYRAFVPACKGVEPDGSPLPGLDDDRSTAWRR